jgi:hypothetical protein
MIPLPHMASSKTDWKYLRTGFAISIALFLLLIGLPSTGYVMSHNFSRWPFWTVVVKPESLILLWVAVLVPLACILYGIRRHRFLEYAGWVLWVAFVVWVVNSVSSSP